jgi:hypothetical protein
VAATKRKENPMPKKRKANTKKRDKTVYQAHALRHEIVHAFPHAGVPEMTVLLGPLAVSPAETVAYRLVWPHNMGTKPKLKLRFIPKTRFEEFINCAADAPAVPPDFSKKFAAMRLKTQKKKERVAIDDSRPGRWQEGWQKLLDLKTQKKFPKTAAVEVMAFNFQADDEEGVYVFELDCGFQPEGPWEGAPEVHWFEHLMVYNKPWTAFPAPGVEDIAELLVDAVNLSAKNGMIWFVHPIYFAEQLLRVRLSKKTKQEIAYCEDLPPDLPAPDSKLVFLQWGRLLAGMHRICLESDGPEEVCVTTDRMAVQVDNPIELTALLKEVV